MGAADLSGGPTNNIASSAADTFLKPCIFSVSDHGLAMYHCNGCRCHASCAGHCVVILTLGTPVWRVLFCRLSGVCGSRDALKQSHHVTRRHLTICHNVHELSCYIEIMLCLLVC